MKRILAAFITILFFSAAYGHPIDHIAALKRANLLLNKKDISQITSYKLLKTIDTPEGEPAVYAVVNETDSKVFILSADDDAPALLAYFDSIENNSGPINPELQWWLEEYAASISAERKSEEKYSSIVKKKKLTANYDNFQPIEPLVKTRWNQSYPYNRQCPVIEGKTAVTGCVATAMAQVMNYWKYPEIGSGEISYRTRNAGTLSMAFNEQPFDWDNMKERYGYVDNDETTVNAVAYLMKACGYSVKMNYGTSESGALVEAIGNAMTKYFNYDKGIKFLDRNAYSDEEWEQTMYDELKNIGPVMISGVSMNGGAHCFICDGYDKDGYFHINWGWGGMSDGYFLLNALEPGSHGIGGGQGAFNYYQVAVTSVMPPVGRLKLLDLQIENSASDSGNVTGKGYIYRVNDFRNILLNLKLRGDGGLFDGKLIFTVYENDPVTMANGAKVYEKEMPEIIRLNDGETGNYQMKVDIPDYNVSNFYTLMISYQLKGTSTILSSLKFAASSAVETINDISCRLYPEGDRIKYVGDESVKLIEIYELGGRKIADLESDFESGVDMKGFPKGIYMGVAIFENGRRKVTKILR